MEKIIFSISKDREEAAKVHAAAVIPEGEFEIKDGSISFNTEEDAIAFGSTFSPN